MTIAKNTICLWYDSDAEGAARFYAETFPDSAVEAVHKQGSGLIQEKGALIGIPTSAGENLSRYSALVVSPSLSLPPPRYLLNHAITEAVRAACWLGLWLRLL